MAHHRYLLLEGGEKLVEFIVRMCSLKEEDVRALPVCKILCIHVNYSFLT